MNEIKRPISRQPIPDDAKRVFEGSLFDVYQWEQLQFDGQKKTFEKIKRPDTVYVLPVDSNGKIFICHQEQPNSTPYYGLIGGRIEKNEDPLSAAKRELSEEAGLYSSSYSLWKAFQFLPKLEWAIYVFIAKELDYTDRRLDAGERIELINVSVEELVELASKQEFGDVEIALLLLRTYANKEEFETFKELL